MPSFRFSGIDVRGVDERGVIDAVSEEAAFDILHARGITPYELRRPSDGALPPADERRTPWYARDIAIGASGHGLSDQAILAELFAAIAAMRLSTQETLRLLGDGAPSAALKQDVQRIAADVADGRALADAFAARPDFTPLFPQIVSIADAANTLPRAMSELAQTLRRRAQLRKKVTGALIYPLILIVAAVAVIALMAFYLVPALAPVFTATERDMPIALAVLDRIRGLVIGAEPLELSLTAFGCGMVVLLLISPGLSSTRRAVVRRTPWIGAIIRDGDLLRVVSALQMLLACGAPLADALAMLARSERGTWLGKALDAAAERLREGGRAAEGLDVPMMPPLALSLFAAGEAVNRIEAVTGTLTTILQQSLDRRIERLLQLVTPILTVVIGGLIALLVYSVMGALLDLGTMSP